MEEPKMEVMEVSKNNVGTAVGVGMQACLDFTLVGTNLFAMYQKKDGKNTFLVMPTETEKGKGMTIDEMVKEVNALISGVNPDAEGLDSKSIQDSVQDVVDASKNSKQLEEGSPLSDIPWKEIKVCLNQAFLYLNTGEKAEYALAISFDTSKLFPAGQSFFNVKGLTLGIWNTDRKTVLERMNLVSLDDCLKELQ